MRWGFQMALLLTLLVELPLPRFCSQLLDGLAVYYQFEGNGHDSSSNHLDLTLFGSPGFAPGLFGQALDLHHDSSQFAKRLIDDTPLDFGSSNFTIQVWIYLYSFGSYEQTFIEKFQGDSGPGWTLTSPIGFQFCFQFYSSAAAFLNGSTTVTTGVWHQLVVRRSESSFDMFFDNAKLTSSSTIAAISSTSNGLLIGRRNPSDNRDFSVDGRLDEVAIWNRALSDAELSALYNGGQGTLLVPIPSLLSVNVTNKMLTLTWEALAGQNYQVQCIADLTQTNWVNVGVPVNAPTNSIVFSHSVTNAQRFYRLLIQPD
jgi:hypothetical protein